MVKASQALSIPSKALKAGSTLPPLAIRTALTILTSILGNASIKVCSACACGLCGLGGFAGAVSSCSAKLTLGLGDGLLIAFDGLTGPLSCASSSKSNSLAVVGDSAPAFCPHA